ncbi:MAG TPA: hypothetical protein VLJ57_24710 [Burkholderiaceae bacterium]|nr:hypothetical protein [Burkholderiaceae bacterium]
MELHTPHLLLRHRVAWVVWVRRAVWLLLPLVLVASFWRSGCIGCAVFGLVVSGLLAAALSAWERSLRRQFIRDAVIPRYLVAKLQAAHPQLKAGDAELVLRGLRQFFMAHLRSGGKFVAMPSRAVDTAWHEFILHTKAYQGWCNVAFGAMLHHTPAEVLGRDPKRNDGLRRSWYWACKEESIDPRKPARLPLLFALDRKFAIPGGFSYVPDCSAINRAGSSGDHCGTSFGESSDGAGDAGGFGGSESSSSGDGGSDGGSGCGGGGCGGGGGD